VTGDVGARAGERNGNRGAQPGRRTGNKRDALIKFEFFEDHAKGLTIRSI
jgi:hypothetical protein